MCQIEYLPIFTNSILHFSMKKGERVVNVQKSKLFNWSDQSISKAELLWSLHAEMLILTDFMRMGFRQSNSNNWIPRISTDDSYFK